MKKLSIGNWFVIIVAVIIAFICVYGIFFNSNVIDFKKHNTVDTIQVITDYAEPVIDTTVVK